MAGSFTRKRFILAAVLVAVLPFVAPYDLNTCSGGSVAQTCTVQFSSHCCKSGTYLSATCCRNSCSRPSFFYSTMTCFRMTNSMCCSMKSLGSESCCNYAEYSRTSTSSVRGDYLRRPTYGTCIGWMNTEYCTNSRSTLCCTGPDHDAVASASCCGAPACLVSYTWRNLSRGYTRCYGTSSYCCYSSKSCCDYNSYKSENMKPVDGLSTGGRTVVLVIVGGIVLFVVAIVVPISVVCCRAKRARRASTTNTTVGFALTTINNEARPQPAFTAVTTTTNPQARPLPDIAVTTISNQSQPQPTYHQPPPYGFLYPPQSDDDDQPPPYSTLQLQAPAAPQIQPGVLPVYQP